MREPLLRPLSQVSEEEWYFFFHVVIHSFVLLPILLELFILDICGGLLLHVMFFFPFPCFHYCHSASNVYWRGWKSACVFYIAGLSSELTLGWQATDCICWNACCPGGILKGCQKRGVSWDVFFPAQKGHSAGKGMAGIRIEAKGPCVIQLGHCNWCSLHSHSSSVTFIFSLPHSLSLLIISVTVSLIFFLIFSFLFLSLEELIVEVLNWLETHQFCGWQKKAGFFQNHTDVHVNFPGPHCRCTTNWAVPKKLI